MRRYITYAKEPHIIVQYELWLRGYTRIKGNSGTSSFAALTGWVYVR
jgi:hypothetical protein